MDLADFTGPQPEPITEFSPSLANQLVACALRAAFARDPAYRTWQRPSTYTALGLVAHAVTETAFTQIAALEDELAIRAHLEAQWATQTDRAAADLQRAWAPAVPPPPTEWPGYALTRTRTIRRAVKLLASRSEGLSRAPAKGTGVEIDLRDPMSGLFGRADRIERDGAATRVVDLKTGLRQDEPSEDQRRQLLLYAVLAHRSTGEWPSSIAIEDASGTQYTSRLDPDEAERALVEIQNAIDEFNLAAQNPDSLLDAADPNEDRCRWCPYRPVCAPYWARQVTDWGHRATFGSITAAGAANDGNYLGLTIESPIDRAGESLHISRLAAAVPAGATNAVIVDWVGAPAERDVRARWSTIVRAW